MAVSGGKLQSTQQDHQSGPGLLTGGACVTCHACGGHNLPAPLWGGLSAQFPGGGGGVDPALSDIALWRGTVVFNLTAQSQGTAI